MSLPDAQAARGAARPHSPPAPRAPLSSPRWRTQTSALQRGAQSHPRPQARPGPCRRAARPSGTEPPRRRRAALCPCGAGWGEEESSLHPLPRPARKRAKSSPNKFSAAAAAGCSESPPPSLGQPVGQPPGFGYKLRHPLLFDTPPPLLFLAPLFLGVLFMGCPLVMGVPDGKGMEATKLLAMPPCQPTPKLAGLCCSDANPDLA